MGIARQNVEKRGKKKRGKKRMPHGILKEKDISIPYQVPVYTGSCG